jgi:predicted alpha/beta hydrolase family esterase
MTNYFIIPGLGNSGTDHWQTWIETTGSNFKRINQTEWDAPHVTDWIETIDAALSNVDLSSVVLVGHSLGCSTIAHWAGVYNKKIKGALLVAPSDLEAPTYNFPTVGFAPVPASAINFKTIVVASENDPWVSIDRAAYFANNWGSEFVNIGMAGHINVASGHGPWPQGLEILQKLG